MSRSRSPSPRRATLGLAWIPLVAACSGQVVGEGPGSGDEETEPAGPGTRPGGRPPGGTVAPSNPGAPVTGMPPGASAPITAPATDHAKTVGRFGTVRLTREEFDNTVRDLLGDTQGLARRWPADTTGGSGFATPGQVGTLEVGNYEEVAQQIAARAAARLSELAPCGTGKSEEACASAFITSFGPRAFRRPVDSDEVAALLALYKTMRAAPISLDHAGAMQGLLEAFLQSPQFLYHWEDGVAARPDATGLRPLGAYALASRLSYFLWRTMPDDKLFEAARSGELLDETKLAGQATRLLADPRAADTVADFHRQWLHLERLETLPKDTKVYPAYTDELRDAMGIELAAFTRQAVLGEGTLEALLAGTKTIVNEPLAKLYGVTGVTGKDFVPATLDRTQRAGVLTTAAFLAVNGTPYASSPVKRGHLIRERFICQTPPPPPATVDITPPAEDPKKQTREKYIEHTNSPECAGCHLLMDPLGFGLEHYDGIGAYRAQEKGRPIDATGSISGVEKMRSFNDAPTLARALIETEEVQRCVALQWTRYALGREETPADAGSMAFVEAHFRASQLGTKALLVSIVRSRAFRFTAP